jgi:DNA polymerase-3 subunit delta'
VIVGQERAVEQFTAAWQSRKLHHAWLLAGPKGVGKATFARAAATRVLAEAAGPPIDTPGLDTPANHMIARLIAAEEPERVRLIDASGDQEQVTQRLLDAIADLLP